MKQCKNLDCVDNKSGFCNKESSSTKSIYDKLTNTQWIKLRNYMEDKKNRGLESNKKCNNKNCMNNVEGECYLLTEMEILNNIL